MLHRLVLVGFLVAGTVVAPVAVTARAGGNEAPLADAGLDQHVELGTTVLLDATGSRDPDGEIETYEWRIDTPDGSIIVPQCPTCGRSEFRPTKTGTYAVTVTVGDDNGVESTDTLYVVVEGSSTPSQVSPPASGSSNPIGIDPPSTSSTTPRCGSSSCVSSPVPEPWVDIEGPSRVAPGEQAGFVLEYGGFRNDPQFGWSIGADGVTGVEEWNSPGDETIYVTAASDARIARDSHDITVTENRQPSVDIQVPDELFSGQSITLTANATDPDGRIVSVEWMNGPTVTVPKGLSQKVVTVIVTDDEGAETKDKVVFEGEVLRTFDSQSTARHTLYCYYNQESERKRQDPDHCEMKNADNSRDHDGYQSVTSNLNRVLRSPHYNVIWKKTDEQISQHSANLGDDVGVRMPDFKDNDGSSPTVPTLTGDQRDAITGDAVTTTTQSFTLNGKTVTNDLDGDGAVNAADWDERFGSDDTSSTEQHRDAVGEAKDARRATERAMGGGGPASSDSGSETSEGFSDSTSSGGSDDSHDSDGDNLGGQSGPLNGALPDHLPGVSASEHAAEKGQQIAEEGLDLGVGY